MFRPRVAAASLSGASDARWAARAAPWVGWAVLGGIAIDEPTREAAREMVGRNREEFLPPDPVAFVDRQLAALGTAPVRPGVNVRSVDSARVAAVAEVCRRHGAVLEVNAHCRQAEMCAAGAGETLLRAPDRLCEQVTAAADAGAAVSVKLRTEVDGVNLPALARRVIDAGADAVHVDAMDSEPVVGEVADAAPSAFLVANNGVRDRATTHEYLALGADAISVGRPSDDLRILARVADAAAAWFDRREAAPDA